MPWAKVVEEIWNGEEHGLELLYNAVRDCARPHRFNMSIRKWWTTTSRKFK